jgi:hypothetical protein
MDRTTLESLLDAGKLQVRCGFHWYDVRRNGKTKQWKRSPDRFEVPCKVGFRITFTLNNNTSDNELRERPQWNPELTKAGNAAIQRGGKVITLKAPKPMKPSDLVGYLVPKEGA